jgi:hypothetical protein
VAKTKWFILATGVAMAVSGPAAAQTDKTASFSVAGKNFTVTVPDGYCLPQGADKALADAFADIDTLNFTHANFRQCGLPDGDNSVIKSERNAQPVVINKAMFIAFVAKQLETELGQQQLAQGVESGGKDVAAGTGEQMSIGGGGMRGAGFDADCVYILGNVAVDVGKKTIPMNFGTCLTLVGGRVFAVHSYALADSEVTFSMLKERSRTIAATITETS